MFDLRKAATNIITEGKCFCLITIVETQGSTPRDVGAKMIVTDRDDYFSIGGGNLELKAIHKAREMLRVMSAPQELDYILGPDTEQCCGGQVKLSLEIIQGMDGLATLQKQEPAQQKTPLYLFGAGHVGTALMRALEPLPFNVQCYDSRPEKNALFLDDLESIINTAPKNTIFIIMTHDHNLDYSLVSAVLKRGDFAFLGLIGSKTKRARFLSRLKKDGLSQQQLDRLTCPIGIAGIDGKEPEIIAASVAAQLLHLRDKYEH